MYCFACTLSLILSCARSVVRVFSLAFALCCAFSLGRILSCTRSGEDWMISLPQVLFRVYYPAHFLLRAFFLARALCCTHFLLHLFSLARVSSRVASRALYLACVVSRVRCYLRVLLTQAFDCFFFFNRLSMPSVRWVTSLGSNIRGEKTHDKIKKNILKIYIST